MSHLYRLSQFILTLTPGITEEDLNAAIRKNLQDTRDDIKFHIEHTLPRLFKRAMDGLKVDMERETDRLVRYWLERAEQELNGHIHTM